MKCLKTNRKWLMVCMVLLFCALLCPVKEVQAKWVPGWSYQAMLDGSSVVKLPTSCTIQVEVGQNVHLEYCFGALNVVGSHSEGFRHAANLKGVTYASSKKSIATVGKNTGLVKTRKVGETKITVTYNKKKFTCTLKVLKKGALNTTKKYKALNTAANTLAKQAGVKITAKNVVSLMEKTRAFQKLAEKYSFRSGFAVSGDKIGNKLIIPAMAAAEAVALRVETYVSENDPIEQGRLTIKALDGKAGSSDITVTLNRAPTEAEIYLLQYHQAMGDYKTKFSKKNVTFIVNRVCQSEYYGEEIPDSFDNYYGECTLTKGSNAATIVLYKCDDWGTKINKKVKLIKDFEYSVYFQDDKKAAFVVQ